MRMAACAKGLLLILAPWEHHNEKMTIKRGQRAKTCLVYRLHALLDVFGKGSDG